jgi:hypothetical protein
MIVLEKHMKIPQKWVPPKKIFFPSRRIQTIYLLDNTEKRSKRKYVQKPGAEPGGPVPR